MTRAAVAAALACASCSIQTGTAMYEATCQTPVFQLASSVPADGATDVPLGTAVTLTFSDFPDPATLAFGPITLRSGAASFDFAATVDLVGKAVVVVPRTPLAAGTEYALDLATAASGAQPLASIAHKKLVGADASAPLVSVKFKTGQTPGGGPPPPPPLTLSGDIQPLFMPPMNPTAVNCTPGCHDATAEGGLDLRGGQATMDGLLAKSTELASLARVQPGDPASSYLLRKLLGTCDIVGDQMPQGEAPWDPPANIRAVSDWIAGGAKP